MGMLGNLNYVFSLIVAFALGFVAVLVMPVAGPPTRELISLEKSRPAGQSVHYKAAIAASSPLPAARPARQPARQISIASLIENDDTIVTQSIAEPRSRWSYPPLTRLVALSSAPFPYSGTVPRTRQPFLNHRDGDRVGRKTRSGRVYWADKTYSDPRVLLHIPREFDKTRPGVMVLFFHGHGATLARDVVVRQKLPAQISGSGINAVLVAPQFAVDARDSSAGNFWNPGGTRRFLDEAAQQLAKMLGDPKSRATFSRMPVVIVGYSGGYLPTAATLANGKLGDRVKGVVLLDGLYGELDKFARWIAATRSGFFLSAYATSTRKGNAALMEILEKRGIDYSTELAPTLTPRSVTFVQAVDSHRDYVTRAWARNPVSDLLSRISWAAPRIDRTRSAALSASLAN